MKSKTIRFLSLLFPCLLVCTSSWAQRGPQDTWYETGKVPLPENCYPHDLIVTDEGTLLMSDSENDVIHELEANGSLIRSFGSPGSAEGQFNNPIALAIGPNNRIYVTDLDNHRVQILERNGSFVKAFGSNGTGDGEFNKPRGLAISADNEVLVSEDGNHRIQVFDANGTFIRKWGSQGNLDGQFDRPLSLDVDSAGNVYVAEFSNKRISIFSKYGVFQSKFTTQSYSNNSVGFINILPNGLIATGGDCVRYEDAITLRTKDGTFIKKINYGHSHYNPTSSPNTQFENGTLVFAHRHKKELVFLEQTYRSLRPNPSKDAPLPEVISVTQPVGTNHLEIKYRITDADSAKVKAGLLAFKDGGNDLSKVIVPKTFIGSVAGKLDENTTTGTIHTVNWDAKADWNVSYGNVELAVVAQDDRELMNFHFLTLPATDSNSTPLKISRSPVDNNDFLNAWYTLLALGDLNIEKSGGIIREPYVPQTVISPDSLNSLQMWLDATDINGDNLNDSLNNNSPIDNWVDKSNSYNNATQQIESNKPLFKGNQLNGKPTIFFDNTNDSLVTALNLSAPYTVGIVYNNLDTNNRNSRAIQGSSNWLIGPYERKNGHYAGGWVYQSSTIEKGRYYAAFAVNNNSRSWFYIDGIDKTTSPSKKSSPGTIFIGSKNGYEPLNGHVAEVMIFNAALSSTEIDNLNIYLFHKWRVGGENFSKIYASSSTTTADGREYLFNKMNLRQASTEELTRAREAATPGVTNKFMPGFKVGPGERPTKVNEYGFDSDSTSSNHYWVVPKN